MMTNASSARGLLSSFPMPSTSLPGDNAAPFTTSSASASSSNVTPNSASSTISYMTSSADDSASFSSLPHNESTRTRATLALAYSFLSLDSRIDLVTLHISSLLRALLKNAQQRVELMQHLSNLKDMRERALSGEFVAQRKSRELLTEAKRELSLQERWALETKLVIERAETEGLDISGPPRLVQEERQDGEIASWTFINSLKVDSSIRRATTHGGPKLMGDEEEQRKELYRRQLYYLNHASLLSEHRTKRLLSLVSSTSTASVTRAELTRLQSLSAQTTSTLEALSEEREDAGERLGIAERERLLAEDKRDEVVLDLVLLWKEEKKRLGWRKKD